MAAVIKARGVELPVLPWELPELLGALPEQPQFPVDDDILEPMREARTRFQDDDFIYIYIYVYIYIYIQIKDCRKSSIQKS